MLTDKLKELLINIYLTTTDKTIFPLWSTYSSLKNLTLNIYSDDFV